MTELRQSAHTYIEHNWPVFPCNPLNKRPLTAHGHLDASLDPKQIDTWWAITPMAMLGVPMGLPSGVFCVDLDIKDKISGVEMWNMMIASENAGVDADTRIHNTPSGGKHYIFIWKEGIRNIPLGKLMPGVEIKADGGYIVVPPSRMADGREYTSNGKAIADAPEWLMQRINEYFGLRSEEPLDPDEIKTSEEVLRMLDEDMGKGVNLEDSYDFGQGPDIDAINAALDSIPSDGYEDWYRLGAAIFRALGDNGYTTFRDWSAKSNKFKEKECQRKWKQVKDIKDINIGSVFYFADINDSSWRDRYEQRKEHQRLQQEKQRQQTQDDVKPKKFSKFRTYALFPIDESRVPLRPWLVPGLFMRGHLTATAAPGGTGKSIFTLCIAIMLATGRSWSNWTPRQQYRTLIINLEEDSDEMRRRAFAAAQHSMGMNDNRILKDWIIAAEYDTRLVIAKQNKVTRSLIREPVVDDLKEFIRDEKFDVIIIDPFAETYEGEETNRELKYVGSLWREVARDTQSAVWLIHHVKKYAQDLQGDVDALRGGGALGNLIRAATTMFNMTKDEAQLYEVLEEDRKLYVRFDDAKGNYNLPNAKTVWFKKETMQLQNGYGSLPNDNVGALMPWNAPDKLGNLTQENIENLVSKIDQGIMVEKGIEYYTLSSTKTSGSSRWVGFLIVKELGCSDKTARDIIKAFEQREILVSFPYESPGKRETRQGCGSKSKRATMLQTVKKSTKPDTLF
jgi:hypothetical protein